MDQLFNIDTITQWVSTLFPSFKDYIESLGPMMMVLGTILGVFTSLLPDPNHHYPVPDLSDLKTELGDSGGFILTIAKWARSLVIGFNWFIATAIYAGFYKVITTIAKFVPFSKARKTA